MIGYQDVLEARARVKEAVHNTPILHSSRLDEIAGGRLLFKMESFQRSGAFKFRGAYHALLRRREEATKVGVVTASSGNHGGALALAASVLGIRATIVMPEDAAGVKVAAIEDTGARIVFCGRSSDKRQDQARAIAWDDGSLFVPPYDHPDVIAGQGTTALEILEEVPDLDILAVPCGGGGLLAGCALVCNHLAPEAELYGVEPSAANDTALSLERGERVTTPLGDTMADGARNVCPGELTFPIIKQHVRSILLVEEDEMARAVHLLLTRLKIVCEPTGALAAAAILDQKIDLAGRTAVVVISGGNVDPAVLADCCSRSL